MVCLTNASEHRLAEPKPLRRLTKNHGKNTQVVKSCEFIFAVKNIFLFYWIPQS